MLDLQNESDWLYQPVNVYGKFDIDKQFYLDNQTLEKQAGYTIYVPFKLSDSSSVLVNLGWLPLGKYRSTRDNISLPAQPIKLQGLLKTPPSKGLVLSDAANQYDKWPALLQYIDNKQISQTLGYRVLPAVIKLQEAAYGDLKIRPTTINMKSEKHIGYAFQWFALSLTLFLIYIVSNTSKLKKR